MLPNQIRVSVLTGQLSALGDRDRGRTDLMKTRFSVAVLLISLALSPQALGQADNKFFDEKSLDVIVKPVLDSKQSSSLFQICHETTQKTIRFVGDPTDGETSVFSYFLACKNISVKQLMDGMTSVYPLRWQRIKENNKSIYIFKDSQQIFDRVYGAKTQQAENIYRQGKVLIDQLKKNKSIGEKLFIKQNELASTRFGDLPSDIQSSIQYMMEQNSERRQLQGQNSIDTSDLTNSQFGIEIKESPGNFDEYALRYRMPNRTGNFRFTTYERGKSERGENFYSAANSYYSSATTTYDLKKMAAESLKNLKNNPELKDKKITLNVQGKRLWEIALILHEKYQINFMMDGKSQHTQRATFSFQDEPLSDALDRLTALYKNTNWGCRPGGLIVLRGPGNSLLQGGNFLGKTLVK
jgi:hypothetical protein